MADQTYLDDGVPISGSFHDNINNEADSTSMLGRTEPAFPPLRNDDIADSPSTDAQPPPIAGIDDNDDNEPAIAKPFARANSPASACRGPANDDKTHERLVYKMHKFSLYETASRYYIVGGDVTERRYRILKIDRTSEDSDLSITDDKIVYSQREMNQLLDTIDDGNKGVTPKPPIELNLVDPFYGAAALHFNNLFERYGAPIYVLNLVKARERTPRESKLLVEFTNAIKYLNQFLPEGKKIIYEAWDMSRAAKSRDQDVIGTLESIAESVVTTTGLFHDGDGKINPIRVQNGVARTNCIDCLDRTNAAQFVIGKRALGHQLHALGILEDTAIDYDTDAVNLFTHMYHDHGDTIAVQYGGSQLVNTMETYRKINQWTSHSRDMIESFKRYYNNSFLDGQRQEAYNLFLGNYIFTQGQPMLWDLATDYYLHHADPRLWSEKTRGDYINWFTPKYLEARSIQPRSDPASEGRDTPVAFFDDYWLEYYRPSTLSSFLKMFPYKMNSTIKYIPFKSTQDGRYDLSPFKIRNETYPETQEKKKAKKEVTIVDPQSASISRGPDTAMTSPDRPSTGTGRGISIQRWLQPAHDKVTGQQGIMKATPEEPSVLPKTKPTPQEKSKAAQWTFTKAVHQSLNPSVSQIEANDYDRYVSHPQSLPLVVSAEEQAENDSEYRDYITGNWHLESHLQTGPEDDPAVYAELLRVGENPLTVTEEDAQKKRYKAYRKWLRGKSFVKQQPVD
ncbi:hypothetical protein BN1723_014000 [Verticillium longisporum]|uniref:SAC domain-containing protein n=1 Tax=Verticillium longisporum TaxID=100787 RepID=A0A0G4M027_VERLO|nr:hypothetical protein BN1723_014000 [Verticillium longisporum]